MLLTGRNLTKWYGPRLLFSGITLGIDEGERIGLIGANGSGKSTLLRIFAQIEPPDEGELVARQLLRIGYVPQEDEFAGGQTGLACIMAAVDERLDEYQKRQRAEMLLDRAGFVDFEQVARTLSGGWQKRLAIVRALAGEPELLLMDEPTNHLDIEGIEWLGQLIRGGRFATLTVSHDRRFLEEAANRIIELGSAYPEGYLGHYGTYSDFLEKREEFLEAQLGRQQALASGVRREIEWLRRGAKARTTKAKGRIERAGEMMSELGALKARNAQQGAAAIEFDASGRKTRKLVEFKNVGYAIEEEGKRRVLFGGVNCVLSPGDRLGLVGPNGSGKSTLIRLLDGQLELQEGQIVRADGLKVVVFDQKREQLDPEQTLRRALAPNGDIIAMEHGAQHVVGWARRFLFRAEQLDMPVKELSGGEQARVLIARLMLRSADVLVLDEPTNDLDIQTLDVLTASLEGFEGALLLVSHDRFLLDRLCTDLLALDGKGGAAMYSDLGQWQRAREATQQRENEQKKAAAAQKVKATNQGEKAKAGGGNGKKRLNWNEQREMERMEEVIAAAEEKMGEWMRRVGDPAVVADHEKMREACDALGEAQQEVERLYARWAELEERMK